MRQSAMVEGRQLTFDVVRGIAILLVLLFHLRVATGVDAVDALLLPIVDAGWAGVDLFFVLSGFLVGRLILVEAASPGGFGLWRFMTRRVLRLWPVLFMLVERPMMRLRDRAFGTGATGTHASFVVDTANKSHQH